MSKFSERLKQLRTQARITQPELAEKLGVSKGAVGNWESGFNLPEMETLRKLAGVLGCSENYLRGDSDEKNDALRDEGTPYQVGLPFSEMTRAELDLVFESRQKEYADPNTGIVRKRVLLGLIAELAAELQKRIPQQ